MKMLLILTALCSTSYGADYYCQPQPHCYQPQWPQFHIFGGVFHTHNTTNYNYEIQRHHHIRHNYYYRDVYHESRHYYEPPTTQPNCQPNHPKHEWRVPTRGRY